MLELNEFAFPSRDYYRLTLRRTATRFAWFFLYGCSAAGCLGLMGGDMFILLLWVIGAGVIFSLATFLIAWRFVYAKENATIFQKRNVTFDSGFCHYMLEDGTESRFPLNTISFIEAWDDYYLLYLTKHTYMPVLRAAFRSDDDRQRFEAEVVAGKAKQPNVAKDIVIYLLITATLLAAGYWLGKPTRDKQRFYDEMQQRDYDRL